MVSGGSILEWRVPCVPSCLKIYLCHGFFPLLNSSFTILCSYFCSSLCFLSAPNRQCSPFSLCDFTIKSLYLERKNQTIITPQNLSQKFVSTSYNLEISSLLATLRSFAAHSPHRSLRRTCSIMSRCL